MPSIIQVYQSKGISGILSDYSVLRDEANAILEIEGKTIRKALMEQTAYQAFYDQKKGELQSLMKFYSEVEMGPVKAKAWKDLTQGSSISLNNKDKEYYLRANGEINKMETTYILMEEMYLEFDAITDAFRARGFALKHISELLIAQLEDTVL